MARALFTRSSEVEVDPGDVPLFFSEIVSQKYISVALMTALVYHSIVTMDKEIKYFWPKPLNHISVIYFANRYVGLLAASCSVILDGLSENVTSCNAAFWVEGVCTLITVVLIDYILVIRVLALYEQNRQLDIVLKCLIALEAVAGLGFQIYTGILEKVVPGVLAKDTIICVVLNIPPKIPTIVSWAISLTFGLILLILALYKAAEYWRLSFGFKGFHLIKVLVRDQVLYYGFVIFCCTLRMVDASIFTVASDILIVASNPTFLCILGGQLLVNLKEAGELGVNEGTNYRSTGVSDINFAEGLGIPDEEVLHEQSIAGSAA